jgi:hypothetical protein
MSYQYQSIDVTYLKYELLYELLNYIRSRESRRVVASFGRIGRANRV